MDTAPLPNIAPLPLVPRPQPHGVEYTTDKLVFLEESQKHENVDNAKEITDDFLDKCAAALPPQLYYVSVVPCAAVKRTKSGLFLSDGAVDRQKWTHGLGQVIACGPAVYQGRTFQELGLTPEDGPKRGDLVLYDPKIPKRMLYHWEGRPREIVMVADHAFYAHIKLDEVSNLSWAIV